MNTKRKRNFAFTFTLPLLTLVAMAVPFPWVDQLYQLIGNGTQLANVTIGTGISPVSKIYERHGPFAVGVTFHQNEKQDLGRQVRVNEVRVYNKDKTFYQRKPPIINVRFSDKQAQDNLIEDIYIYSQNGCISISFKQRFDMDFQVGQKVFVFVDFSIQDLDGQWLQSSSVFTHEAYTRQGSWRYYGP